MSSRTSYYSSSSGPCAACNQNVRFFGTDFRDGYVVAAFVIACITLAVILGCLFASPAYSRWREARGYYGRAGKLSFAFAAFFTIVALVLGIARVALEEKSRTVKLSFEIVNIFQLAAAIVAEILTFSIFTRYVQDSFARSSKAFAIIKNLTLFFLSALGTAVVALAITYYAYILSNARPRAGYITIGLPITLVFDVIFLGVILAFAVVWLINSRAYLQRSYKTAMLVLILVLLINRTFQVAIDAIVVKYTYGYGFARTEFRDLSFAAIAGMLVNLSTAIIFVLYLVVARIGANMPAPNFEDQSVAGVKSTYV